MKTTPESILKRIARETMGIQTLRTRHRDRLDFHDVAVWSVKEALGKAYEEGLRMRTTTNRNKQYENKPTSIH